MSSIIGGTVPIGIFGDSTITNISTTDHLIQGQMIEVNMTLESYELIKMSDDQIKTKLLFFLADEMMKRKCVEFTKQQRHERNETVIRARIFVTPDTNVRIIRTFQNDNKR